MDLFRQLKIAGIVVLALLVIGTAGYMLIEHVSLIDAVYMTVGVLTTLGITRELSPAGKVFTSTFALGGVFAIFTVVFWAVGNAVQTAASEKTHKLLGRRKMDKAIGAIKNHYIICGYGRMGQAIAKEFRSRGVPFVVIENNPEQLPRLVEEKALYVEGDASDEDTLLSAGIRNARGLIAVAPTDPDNTFIVLTAKGINPKLFVVARSIKTEDEPKLRRAGADRVMSPYILGGKRMAWAVLRPTVVDFLESAVFSESLEMEISEIPVNENTSFANKSLRQSGIRERSGATVFAIKNPSGALTSSPSPDQQMRPGDVLIAVGTPRQLETLQRMAES